MSKAIVLLSGGMDSTVAAYWAREHYDEIVCLGIEYGQRHWVELDAARRVAGKLGAEFKVAAVGPSGVGPSMLMQSKTKDVLTAADSVVPARNVLFLWSAAVFAQTVNARAVVMAVCGDDQADYLDCRRDTIDAMQETMALALGRECDFVTPFVAMNKVDILREAKRLDCWQAVVRSWSCYNPRPAGMRTHERTPCEKCPACIKRAAAFLEVTE